jgi:hypothetical protein
MTRVEAARRPAVRSIEDHRLAASGPRNDLERRFEI